MSRAGGQGRRTGWPSRAGRIRRENGGPAIRGAAMRRLAGVLVLGAIAGVGCADISAPRREAGYDWRLLGGDEPISFHWPEAELPVRIWVEDDHDMPALIRDGADQWNEAFLYNEFRYTITSDSSNAHIIVRTVPPPAAVSAIRLGSMMAPQCRGATDVFIPPEDQTVLVPPIRAYVYPHLPPETPGFDECMALTATHELGHAIGIFRHSPDPTDLMYPDPIVPEPSEADLATAEVLYHWPNTVELAPGAGE